MALTVVGSIAFDSVRTPFGERERMLGGSAVHFALAASFLASCSLSALGATQPLRKRSIQSLAGRMDRSSAALRKSSHTMRYPPGRTRRAQFAK